MVQLEKLFLLLTEFLVINVYVYGMHYKFHTLLFCNFVDLKMKIDHEVCFLLTQGSVSSLVFNF